ncbi:Aste57867_12097 [Aphanomyces stellatus]|uniref:Aste57867_12097 protein n=1 Tax=Aphanomyces stellatus TaxID=120398 RepID=A0A485KUN5_9STRA|nr:hypothetical protein As57867_012052 [Aphanomyces stellatus]VFT88952.1 Aste57867_12097 [Aphanomyces stellatus]
MKRARSDAGTASAAVVRSPDLMQHLLAFQSGIYLDLVPLHRDAAPLRRSGLLLNALADEHDAFDAVDQLLRPWYAAHGTSLLPRLLNSPSLDHMRPWVIYHAVYCGRLDALVVVLKTRTATTSLHALTDLMDVAAWRGHLSLLEALHDAGHSGCTTDAIDNAAMCGHLDVVRFLHENRSEGSTTMAMDGAAANGHVEMVRYLHAQRSFGCTTDAMDHAAAAGHLEVVRFLHDNRTEGCTTDAMDGAATNGHVEMVRFLHDNRTEGCTTEALDMAAKAGHLDVVLFLVANREEGCSHDALALAATDDIRLALAQVRVVNHDDAMGSPTPSEIENWSEGE